MSMCTGSATSDGRSRGLRATCEEFGQWDDYQMSTASHNLFDEVNVHRSHYGERGMSDVRRGVS